MLMQGTLTVGERIVLHLSQYSKYIDSYDAPVDISQDGIAAALRISRAHAAIELKKLKDGGEVVEKLVHIRKGKTKRKVYFLLPPGEERAVRIRQFAESEGIDIQPFLDLRKCKGPELWSSLDDENKSVLAMACIFRRPFHRAALPETSIALLPTDALGMVDLPEELRLSIPPLVAPGLLRQYHSLAADYWLREGDYRERLYHLIHAGRGKEAEMLLASKGAGLLPSADRDLLSIVSSVHCDSERYRGRVWYVQAEAARRVGDHGYCLEKAKALQGSSDLREVFNGLLVEGLLLRDQGQYDRSLSTLVKARDFQPEDSAIRLECEIADTLIPAARYQEAKEVLERLIASGVKDGDQLERIFFQLGTIALRTNHGTDAVRFFSKSRGAAKDKENGELYTCLADAYNLLGMREKATEYALRAKRVRPSSSTNLRQPTN